MAPARRSSPWFPFVNQEVQVALAVLGVALTALPFAGASPETVLWSIPGGLLGLYVVGLLAHRIGAGPKVEFIPNGGVGGAGYLRAFRRARRCLYLMHVDDDPPNEELQGLYRVLLERGVQIRRTVFLRQDAAPSAYDWIVRFGNHPSLQHRVVLPNQASVMRHGFVVVDDKLVLLSVPGHEAIDGQPYTEKLVLRHLLVIDDQQIATAFLRVHEVIWQHAKPLVDVAQLADSERLSALVRARRPAS